MAIEQTRNDANGLGVELVLDPSLLVKEVEAARLRFLEALNGAARIVVDAGRVAAVDTAGVQLLLALQIAAAARGIPIEWRAPSAVLVQALHLLGLSAAVLGEAQP